MRVLLTEREISDIVFSLCSSLKNRRDPEREMVLVPVLEGGMMLCCDIAKQLWNHFGISVNTSSVCIRSYEGQKKGKYTWEKKPDRAALKGRTVVVVDDINETGGTLQEVVQAITECDPVEILTVTLLSRANTSFFSDYTGIVIEEGHWLVGYGLDDDRKNRNITSIQIKE